MDAPAANPHRDGAIQDSWSRPDLAVERQHAAGQDDLDHGQQTSSGMAFSDVLTNAETSRPSAIEATDSRAMATISSSSGVLCSSAPCGGHLPAGQPEQHEHAAPARR